MGDGPPGTRWAAPPAVLQKTFLGDADCTLREWASACGLRAQSSGTEATQEPTAGPAPPWRKASVHASADTGLCSGKIVTNMTLDFQLHLFHDLVVTVAVERPWPGVDQPGAQVAVAGKGAGSFPRWTIQAPGHTECGVRWTMQMWEGWSVCGGGGRGQQIPLCLLISRPPTRRH